VARILIVDDRATSRQLLATLLGYVGHRVWEASDGVEALALARREPFFLTMPMEPEAILHTVDEVLGLGPSQAPLPVAPVVDREHLRRITRGRELHDEIGQSLTAVNISSDFLEKSRSLIERVLQQVRSLSLDPRPSVLDDLGLVAALRSCLDRLAKQAVFVGRPEAHPPGIRSDTEIETACLRVAQEALTEVRAWLPHSWSASSAVPQFLEEN
jgi:CheY-like chemotaxis protein